MVRIVNILSLLFIKLRKHILTVMDVRFIGLETESHGRFWIVVYVQGVEEDCRVIFNLTPNRRMKNPCYIKKRVNPFVSLILLLFISPWSQAQCTCNPIDWSVTRMDEFLILGYETQWKLLCCEDCCLNIKHRHEHRINTNSQLIYPNSRSVWRVQ